MSTAEPQRPASPVTGDTGCCQMSTAASLNELPAPDIVAMGGSLLDEDPDERLVDWLRQVPAQGSGRDGLCRAIAAEQIRRARSLRRALGCAHIAITATECFA